MITVHGMHTEQNDFNNCGLAIIKPTSAYITEELNGRYDMEIEVPCIPDDPREGRHEDSWKFIKMYNILKSSEGQLFMIHKIDYSMKNGVPYIRAYANHIWYYLADMLTMECNGRNVAWQAVDHLFVPRDVHGNGCTWFSGGTGLTTYTFSKYINPELNKVFDYNYKNISLASALLGNSDSVVNLWGGEIWRDNFQFRIDKHKYDSMSDAFELVYGVNCRDVKYTEDTTNRKTEVHVSCNNGKFPTAKSIIPDAGLFPHQAISGLDFSYEQPSQELVFRDLDAWWEENTGWLYNWEVDYVDFKGTDKGAGWDQMRKIRVGDTGIVQDAFGHRQTQKVIATKYNDITGRLESVKLGSFKESGLHESRWDKKIMKSEDEPVMNRVRCIERELGTDISNIAGNIQNINSDIGTLNSDVDGINHSIDDINAAIQDIYSKLPNP
jgi:phage-related protein